MSSGILAILSSIDKILYMNSQRAHVRVARVWCLPLAPALRPSGQGAWCMQRTKLNLWFNPPTPLGVEVGVV